MPPRAILFDLDGTLLDTLDDLADAMNHVLAACGCPVHPVGAYRYFVGDGMRRLVERALPADRRDDETVHATMAAMRERYGRHWADKTRPYAGVAEMLDALAARGLLLAVFSNKPHEFTRLAVDLFLSRWSFTEVAGAKPDVPVKPDPTGALAVAETLHVAPADFLYLGDTGTDMRTAVAAGMFPVGALWGFRDRAELLEHGARRLVETPAQVLDLL